MKKIIWKSDYRIAFSFQMDPIKKTTISRKIKEKYNYASMKKTLVPKETSW